MPIVGLHIVKDLALHVDGLLEYLLVILILQEGLVGLEQHVLVPMVL